MEFLITYICWGSEEQVTIKNAANILDALFKFYANKIWIMISEGEHLGNLLKEALWKEAP